MFLGIIALVLFIVKSAMQIIIGGKIWGKMGASLDDIDVKFASSTEVLREFAKEAGLQEEADQIQKLEAVVAKSTGDNVVDIQPANPRRAGARNKQHKGKP
jgi:hypothetical protein